MVGVITLPIGVAVHVVHVRLLLCQGRGERHVSICSRVFPCSPVVLGGRDARSVSSLLALFSRAGLFRPGPLIFALPLSVTLSLFISLPLALRVLENIVRKCNNLEYRVGTK